MVDKHLKYKLALLGCTSFCLINVASAQSSSDHIAFSVVPEIGNIACGAGPRSFVYQVKNISTRYDVEIEDYGITIGEDDQFIDVNGLTTASTYCLSDDEPGCTVETILAPGETCTLQVTIDPSVLDCPTHFPIEDGEIERALTLEVDAGAQRLLASPIDIDVTILGTAEYYAVLADQVFLFEADDVPNTGFLQVSQDVGSLNTGDSDFDDIWFHDGSELLLGLLTEDNPFNIFLPNQNVPAFLDVEAAYNTFLAAGNDDDSARLTADPDYLCDEGNFIDGSTLGGSEFNGGIYCIAEDIDGNITVDGNITYMGDEDSIYVMVMNSQIENTDTVDVPNPVVLSILSASDFDFENQNTPVKSNNIYWVGADQIILCQGAEFAGNILTKGYFDTDISYPIIHSASLPVPCTPDFVMKDPAILEVPGTIEGRVLGLTDVPEDDFFTWFTFTGNTISEPIAEVDTDFNDNN